MKQKILRLIILATLIVSCDNRYSEKNNSVYYELPPMFPRDLHFSPPKMLVKYADAASFEELEKGYGKDKNHVFYKGYLIENADPATFKIIDYVIDDFDKDKPYSKDNNSVFNGGSEIPEADPKTFQILLKVPYLKDDKDYYVENTPLNVDMSTFKLHRLLTSGFKQHLYQYYGYDSKFVYFAHLKLPIVNNKIYKYVTYGFANDIINVHYLGKSIKDIDTTNFQYDTICSSMTNQNFEHFVIGTKIKLNDPLK